MEMLAQREELEAQEKQRLLWTQFLIAIYSRPATENESPELKRQRQAFIDSIQPKGDKNTPAKKLEWPQAVLEQAQQEGG